MTNGAIEILSLINWLGMNLYVQILKDIARSGKSVEELLAEAEDQTKANTATIAALRAKLEAMDPDN